MQGLSQKINSKLIVERLTALWALNEAGFGGLMHAVKSPFTGILIGGTAVMLITLIAWFAEKPSRAILKATSIVLIVKLSVSPHSPISAYLAVSFQAVLGAILFTLLSNSRLAALVLGVVALVESAVQKLLVLTIVYGQSIWEAIDVFFQYILQQLAVDGNATQVGFSRLLVFLYLAIHVVAGIIVGYLAGRLPEEVQTGLHDPDLQAWQNDVAAMPVSRTGTKRKRTSFLRRKTAISLLALIAITAVFVFMTPSLGGFQKGMYVIIRVTIILFVWYYVLAPVLSKLLHKFLKRRRVRYGDEIENILQLFPHLKVYARQVWHLSAEKKGWQRWKQFIVQLVVYTLVFDNRQPEQGEINPETENAG